MDLEEYTTVTKRERLQKRQRLGNRETKLLEIKLGSNSTFHDYSPSMGPSYPAGAGI